jgi:hypothetical protein
MEPQLHKLFKSTMGQLEFFKRRVREGVLVEDCQDFARYVRQSGMCAIMELHPPLGDTPRQTSVLKGLFPYDGNALYRAAEELRLDCCRYYEGRTATAEGTAKGADKSDLESIDRKLDLIAGRLSQLESVKKTKTRHPRLRLVKGATA